MYTQSGEEDRDHNAHLVQSSLKVADNKALHKKTLYFKFPDGLNCDALHSNGEVDCDQQKKLAMKPLPMIL